MTNVLALIAAIGSVIAAAGTLALIARGWGGPSWRVAIADKGPSRVTNVGHAARDIHVRAGSIGTPEDRDDTASAERLGRDESVTILVVPMWQGPADFGVVVTWRRPLRRRGRWTYPLY